MEPLDIYYLRNSNIDLYLKELKPLFEKFPKSIVDIDRGCSLVASDFSISNSIGKQVCLGLGYFSPSSIERNLRGIVLKPSILNLKNVSEVYFPLEYHDSLFSELPRIKIDDINIFFTKDKFDLAKIKFCNF